MKTSVHPTTEESTSQMTPSRGVLSSTKKLKGLNQCESRVFFPDNPAQLPQFSDCPRQAVTERRTTRHGDTSKGEPAVVSYVVKLCDICAKCFDEADKENRKAIVS